jgi:hypothetical protein
MTYGMTFDHYLKYKWLGAAIQIEEITPLVVNSNGKIKFKATYYPENIMASSNRNTVPVPDPAGPRRMNKPWDLKKARAALAVAEAAQTIKFFAKCNDGDDASGGNDFVVVVECLEDLVGSFVANWDICQTKAAKKREYSVNDIYKGMAKKGYSISGLHTKFTVGY